MQCVDGILEELMKEDFTPCFGRETIDKTVKYEEVYNPSLCAPYQFL